MTIRDLLTSYDPRAILRLRVYDRDYDLKSIKVCFSHASDCEDDLEYLDMIADEPIERWYYHSAAIIIVLKTKFRKGFADNDFT